MSEPVRLGLAGAGLIGQRHAAAIRLADGARLAAIADPAPAGADLATRHNVPVFAGIDAMLARADLDGVIIATPNALHLEHGLLAIDAGIPALIEKPLATDIGEAARLVHAAERAGTSLLAGHHRRYNPVIARANALIEAGQFGRIIAVHASFWLAKPETYFSTPWRRSKGAGPILVNLIHDLDLLRHLCGEIMSVRALASSAARGFEIEDSAVVLLTFANGALGTVTMSDAIPAPWSWELASGENDAYARAGQSCYQIGGTMASLELPSLRVWRHEGDPNWWNAITASVDPWPHGDPLVRQIEHFARVIGGQTTPLVSGREGLLSLAVIEAVARSAALNGAEVRPGDLLARAEQDVVNT